MNYWLHRCKYEDGHHYLKDENRLTIGFSACAQNEEMCKAVQSKDGNAFDKVYGEIYQGGIWRSRYALWYFTCEMQAGDFVVVPFDGGFRIYQLEGTPNVSVLKDSKDIGWEWKVKKINEAFPREPYASSALLSRMKARQTTLCINDLTADVNDAIERIKDNRPFSLKVEMAKKCKQLLCEYSAPDHFERVVAHYFQSLGANTVTILPKNYAQKQGDCDVEAIFPKLRHTISIQVKKHSGATDDFSVDQIHAYAQAQKDAYPSDENWSYAYWVISLADKFTDDAMQKARENGILLINGDEFCRMLIESGISID